MGFLKTLTSLLEENSNESIEKKLTKAIDKVEHTLNSTAQKAEVSIRRVDTAGQRLAVATERVESVNEKAEQIIIKKGE